MVKPETPRDGRYYADAHKVWKAPIHTPLQNGALTITIGFPVCNMSDVVGNDAAPIVAELMNRGEVLPVVFNALEKLAAYVLAKPGIELPLEWSGIMDALKAARERTKDLKP